MGGRWEVQSLYWDMPSTLLAVGLVWTPTSTPTTPTSPSIGVVQIYTRGNYHWYLKQQWTAVGLRCLGFDTEVVGRLFMVQTATSTPTSTSTPTATSTPTPTSSLASASVPVPTLSTTTSSSSTSLLGSAHANTHANTPHACANELRMVDLVWDILMSGTPDGSMAVIDGATMLLTPLAYHTVPPPMAMYRQVRSCNNNKF